MRLARRLGLIELELGLFYSFLANLERDILKLVVIFLYKEWGGMFLKTLIDNITENIKRPRSQVERQLMPIIDIFIKDVINNHHDEVGRFEVISSEFPLPIGDDKKSKSVDYLFFDNKNNSLLFIEIKTASDSFEFGQFNAYFQLIKRIKNESACFLSDFLSSLNNKKFKYLKGVIDSRFSSEKWSTIKDASLTYIAPSGMKVRKWSEKNNSIIQGLDVIPWSSLFVKPEQLFFEEWEMMQNLMDTLDYN